MPRPTPSLPDSAPSHSVPSRFRPLLLRLTPIRPRLILFHPLSQSFSPRTYPVPALYRPIPPHTHPIPPLFHPAPSGLIPFSSSSPPTHPVLHPTRPVPRVDEVLGEGGPEAHVVPTAAPLEMSVGGLLRDAPAPTQHQRPQGTRPRHGPGNGGGAEGVDYSLFPSACWGEERADVSALLRREAERKDKLW